jgi:hypothetical protein
MTAVAKAVGAKTQLRTFIGKFEPKRQALIRSVRRALQRRFPTAFELVYDNYNFFVIGYSPTEHPSDAIVSITAHANGVGLCFIQGASLPDPEGILQGSGKQTRFIRVPSVDVLSRPAVKNMLDAAARQAEPPFRKAGRCTLIIRSVSARQRARRRPAG